MTVQNSDNFKFEQNRFGSSSENKIDSSGTAKIDSSKHKPSITRESVERTNKKIGSFQSKIIEANHQIGPLAKKQTNLEKLETKVLKAQSFFNQADAELKTLSARKEEINLKLGNLPGGDSSAELLREELKSVTNQIYEIEELKASDFGGGASLVSSSLQQVQVSLAELKNIEQSISELSRQYPVLRDLSDENKQLLLTIPKESMKLLMPTIRNMLDREMDQSDTVKIVFGMHGVMEALLRNYDGTSIESVADKLRYPPGSHSERSKPEIANILENAMKIITPETPGDDVNEIIKELSKTPANQRDDVVKFAMELFPLELAGRDDVGVQSLIMVIKRIPHEHRDKVVDVAKGLFTENMSLMERLDCIKLLKNNVDDSKTVGEFLTILRDMHGFDLLPAFEYIPPAQMKDILEHSMRIASDNMSYLDFINIIDTVGKIDPAERGRLVNYARGLFTEDMKAWDKIIMIETLIRIPITDRKDVIDHAKDLFTKNMSTYDKTLIIDAFADISKDDRQDLSLELLVLVLEDEGVLSGSQKSRLVQAYSKLPSADREGVNALAKTFSRDSGGQADLIIALANIRKEDRDSVVMHARELMTNDMSTIQKIDLLRSLSGISKLQREDLGGYAFKLIATGYSVQNLLIHYTLKNERYRETVVTLSLKKLQDAENLSESTVNFISDFVYDNRTVLGLEEGHPLIKLAYLNVPNKILDSGIKLTYLESKDLSNTDAKVDTISKTQFETWNKLKSQRARIEKITAKDLKLGGEVQTIELRAANVTEEEANSFQQALGIAAAPGEIGKYVIDTEFEPIYTQNIKLQNGNIIFPGEQNAIDLYTSSHYRLINATLDKDANSLFLWRNHSINEGKNATDEFVKEAQAHVMKIAEVATSGMNKLPSYEGLLYRGAAMTDEKLEGFRQGAVMMTKKFYSCSTNVDVCEGFAKTSAADNMMITKTEYKPVLYVFKSENAKDIQQFSQIVQEEERVYAPGQGFRSVGVDEKTIPGLAIIYMEEMN